MRLDVLLFERGLSKSRTDAKVLISSGEVTVNGKCVTKPAYDVSDTDDVLVNAHQRYVSRGGLKLEYAMSSFDFSVNDKLAIDVGASSGGFTDCLLQNGIKHVIAVDSGSGQLASSLSSDSRVTSVEGYNARYMKPSDFPYAPNIAVMDVSFISATLIIAPLFSVLSADADFICLIKPQFEVGRENIGKGGIVRDEKAREAAISKVVDFAKGVGFIHKGTVRSPIEGGDGNVEFLAHFKKPSSAL